MSSTGIGCNRREMLERIGGLAALGGWVALAADQISPQAASGQAPKPAGSDSKEYTLAPLPYGYDALEPHIDAQTMTLHHTKHHKSYVDGLNAALAGLDAARKSGTPEDMDRIRALTDALSFNGSGHALHTVFWSNMKKGGGGEPSGPLAQQIDRDFGNLKNFQANFSQAAARTQGSGWGVLAFEPLGNRLIVLSAEKHQNQTLAGCVPLLVLDVWEHAYYLKYQNKRAEYVAAFWNVVNWDNVADRAAMAMKLAQ